MKLFGTDGIRGLANEGPLTPESVLKLGQAIGLSTLKMRRDRPLVIVGVDPRLSSAMLESALIAGIASVGVDVFRTGVIPTPAVPMLITTYKADAGVMITASHNPYYDNGLKVFGPQGYKIPRAYEDLITQTLTQGITERPTHDRIGRVRDLRQAEDTYAKHLTRRVTSFSGLKGLRIAVDCANGAAHRIAPRLFERLGLSVQSHAVCPTAQNINKMCGATYTQGLSEIIRSGKSDIGVAFDGDADRCIMIDEQGDIVDGDHILYMIGRHMKAAGSLDGDTIVATAVSNLGLDHALAQHGIDVVRSPVGDRFVAEKMREIGSRLGGEKSGHTLVGQAYVGDGLATALSVLDIMNTSDQPLSDLKSEMVEFPQADRNVKVECKIPIANLPRTQSAIKSAENAVGSPGDVTVRYSGTENLIRVTVQGRDRRTVDAQADMIAETFRQESPLRE